MAAALNVGYVGEPPSGHETYNHNQPIMKKGGIVIAATDPSPLIA